MYIFAISKSKTMEQLFQKSTIKIDNVEVSLKRYLYKDINFKNRLIAILGARGTGKTTLLLQIAKGKKSDEVLYVALDDLFFTNSSLYDVADKFSKLGGKLLLLDEVHKYPNWSREIKLIFDDLPKLQIIFTSSSILDIYKGESDLSRRAVSYTLHELSFREYLLFYEKIDLPVLSLDTILNNHIDICLDLLKKFKPYKYFTTYLKFGIYPYFEGNVLEYHQKILNTVNLILDIDIQSTQGIDYNNIAKIKKLLYVIASNVPFTPNISKLSEKIEINRNSLIHILQLLEKAELIHTLTKSSRSISVLSKPDKIWMHNTNLCYAVSGSNPDIGTLRETFILQHISPKHSISLPDKGDFLVNQKYIFEVGGRNKSHLQIKELKNSFLIKDDIEVGAFNSIPIWIFGFLY
jgi:uncharacterized protein